MYNNIHSSFNLKGYIWDAYEKHDGGPYTLPMDHYTQVYIDGDNPTLNYSYVLTLF